MRYHAKRMRHDAKILWPVPLIVSNENSAWYQRKVLNHANGMLQHAKQMRHMMPIESDSDTNSWKIVEFKTKAMPLVAWKVAVQQLLDGAEAKDVISEMWVVANIQNTAEHMDKHMSKVRTAIKNGSH
jgi:hypothetical protein